MLSFGFQMVLTRIKRLKSYTLITTFGISIVCFIFIAITYGSNVIQTDLISNSLNSVITDMNIRIIGEDNDSSISLKELTDNVSNLDNVDRAIIKLFPKIESPRESFSLSRDSILSFSGNESINPKAGLFGFSNEDFDFYEHKIQSMLKIQVIPLDFTEAIISNHAATKLQLRIGDSFYLHYLSVGKQTEEPMNPEIIASYNLTVGSIWDITNTHSVFQDISQIPTDNIHEPAFITDFVILEEKTYLNIITAFFPDVSNSSIFNHGIISVFIDHTLMINQNNFTLMLDQFSQLKINILRSIKRSIPPTKEIIWQSSLEKELETIITQISDSTFSFTLFCLLLMSIVIIFYFIMIHLKIQYLKHHLGIMRLRGVGISNIYYSFLFEGSLLGIIAGLISILLSSSLIIAIDSIYFFQYSFHVVSTDISFQMLLALSIGSISLGLLLGLVGHSLIIFQNKSMIIKDLLYRFTYNRSISSKSSTIHWPNYFLVSIITLLVWLLEDFLLQFDFGGIWSVFLSIGHDILSIFVLLVPLFLIMGFLRLFLDKKEQFNRLFTPLLRPITGDLTNFFLRDFMQKQQQTTRMIFIIICITITAITPPILISTQEKIDEINITYEVGADIRITAKFDQFEDMNPRMILESYPNTILSSSYIISQPGLFYTGSINPISAQMIFLQTPSSYLNTVQFEDLSASLQQNTAELMELLEGNNILAPISYADHFNWNIGDIKQISLVTENDDSRSSLFRIVGFYQWLPGIGLPLRPTVHAFICNFDFLANQTDIVGNADTVFVLKLNQSISNQEKSLFIQNIQNSFYSFQVELLDDKLNEYHRSFKGRFNTIFDVIFILAILLGSLGISWFIIGIFQSRQRVFSILRSRGMKRKSIMIMITLKILLLDFVGLLGGLIIGIIANIIYIDFLISQTNQYLHFLPQIPVIKIFSFIGVIFTSHMLVITILLTSWSRKSIISGLGFKE